MSKIKPNIVRGGRAIDLGNNLFYMSGKKHSQGGIDIGQNAKTGLEVEGGEVVQITPQSLKVFSAQPILNGISPAQYILGGANPNQVFNAQEYWKQVNKVNDDGTKAIFGVRRNKNGYTTKLNKRQEAQFRNWYKNVSSQLKLDENPDTYLNDYDYRGYWLENKDNNIDFSIPNFHFPDKYKTPFHETFSNESVYASKKYGVNPKDVGHWEGDVFVPGVFNNIMQKEVARDKEHARQARQNIGQYFYNLEPYAPSQEIIDYIKDVEKFSPTWYKDGKGIDTIGYGFTGSDIKKQFPNGITKEEADRVFADSLAVRAKILERDTPNWSELNQNQRDALLSYHYNIGEGAYRDKNPNLMKALEEGDWETATQNIDFGYNDKKNSGLKIRRDYERNLFNTPVEYKYGGKSKNPTVTVNKGDSWISIANKNNINLDDLFRWNNVNPETGEGFRTLNPNDTLYLHNPYNLDASVVTAESPKDYGDFGKEGQKTIDKYARSLNYKDIVINDVPKHLRTAVMQRSIALAQNNAANDIGKVGLNLGLFLSNPIGYLSGLAAQKGTAYLNDKISGRNEYDSSDILKSTPIKGREYAENNPIKSTLIDVAVGSAPSVLRNVINNAPQITTLVRNAINNASRTAEGMGVNRISIPNVVREIQRGSNYNAYSKGIGKSGNAVYKSTKNGYRPVLSNKAGYNHNASSNLGEAFLEPAISPAVPINSPISPLVGSPITSPIFWTKKPSDRPLVLKNNGIYEQQGFNSWQLPYNGDNIVDFVPGTGSFYIKGKAPIGNTVKDQALTEESTTVNKGYAPRVSKYILNNVTGTPLDIYSGLGITYDENNPKSLIFGTYKYGGIHIKKSKRGTFTAEAKRRGLSVQELAARILANKHRYSSAMIKKAVFAKNARKWKHKEFGGEMTNNYYITPNNIYKLGGRKKAVDGTQSYLRNIYTLPSLTGQLDTVYVIGNKKVLPNINVIKDKLQYVPNQSNPLFVGPVYKSQFDNVDISGRLNSAIVTADKKKMPSFTKNNGLEYIPNQSNPNFIGPVYKPNFDDNVEGRISLQLPTKSSAPSSILDSPLMNRSLVMSLARLRNGNGQPATSSSSTPQTNNGITITEHPATPAAPVSSSTNSNIAANAVVSQDNTQPVSINPINKEWETYNLSVSNPLTLPPSTLPVSGLNINRTNPGLTNLQRIGLKLSNGLRTGLNAVGNFIRENPLDVAETAINLGGNLAASLINRRAIKDLQSPSAPLPLRANKLKTRVNINPQLDEIRETVSSYEDDVTRNTASSKTALANKQNIRARGMQYANQLYGQKENLETSLINEDRMNQQNVGNQNVQLLNNWLRDITEFNNNKRFMQAENSVAGINNAAEALSGLIGGVRTNKQINMQRDRDILSAAIMAVANPNAQKVLGDASIINSIMDNIRKQFYTKK